jgi:hypothetical protein
MRWPARSLRLLTRHVLPCTPLDLVRKDLLPPPRDPRFLVDFRRCYFGTGRDDLALGTTLPGLNGPAFLEQMRERGHARERS